MAKVVAGMAMSLDGFVEDENGSVGQLYPDMDAMHEQRWIQEAIEETGAVVMGKKAYGMGGDTGFEGYEFQVPLFIVTHHVPEVEAKGANDKLSFTFVTDGIESAIAQAKAAAGDKVVTIVGGASTVQQALNAGLVDEVDIDLRSVLLGGGLRLFENLTNPSLTLEIKEVAESALVTHIRYKVVKQ